MPRPLNEIKVQYRRAVGARERIQTLIFEHLDKEEMVPMELDATEIFYSNLIKELKEELTKGKGGHYE